MKRAKKGFTLIEVICVLVIIAIVAVIAVPSISKYIDNSKINNCKSTMNSFINDLEYKIVSRRYYDVDELNRELVNVVDEASVEMNPKMDPEPESGKFEKLTEDITETTGICPNGGHYTIQWIITPGDADNPNTAKVKLAHCICDCMNDEEKNVQLSSAHEFTASLIDTSEYVKSGRTKEEVYIDEIKKLLDMYNSDARQPALVDDVVMDINRKSRYQIIGMTVSETKKTNENNVEWILVDFHEDYSAENDDNQVAHKFIVYYPFDDQMEIFDYSENDYKYKDNWPSAEGNEGSYLYLDGLNYSNGKTYQVADVKKNDVEWIQRERKWYVQKNDTIKGADTDSVILKSRDKLDRNSTIDFALTSTSDLKNFLTVSVGYSGSSERESFGHLDVSENYKSIKNGYVLVKSEEEAYAINWSGLLSDNDKSLVQEQALKKILEDEDKLVTELQNFIQSGSYIDWSREKKYVEVILAYQECYKDGDGNYDPQVCFGKIRFYTYNNSTDIKIVPVINGTEEEAIGSISSEYVPGSYNIKYEQKDDSGVFKIEDLTVTKNVKYTIYDSDRKIKSEYISNVVLSSTPQSYKEENGFYLSIDGYSNEEGKPTDKTAEMVKKINEGTINHGFAVLPTTADHNIRYTPIAMLKLGTVDLNSLKCSYEKGENDEAFYLDDEHIKVSVNFPLELEKQQQVCIQKYGNVNASVNGIITVDFKHRTSYDGSGWFLTDKNSQTYNKENESALLEQINKYEAGGKILLYQTGSGQLWGKHLFDVGSELLSVSANYDGAAREKQRWFLLNQLDKLVEDILELFDFTYDTGTTGFTEANIASNAYYRIEISNKIKENEIDEIYLTRPLDHIPLSQSNIGDRRYYLSKNSNETVENIASKDDSTYTYNLKNGSKISENVFLYYMDPCSSNYKMASFRVNLKNNVIMNDFIYFKIDDNNVYLVAYRGNDPDVMIPSTVKGTWYWESQFEGLGSYVNHDIIVARTYMALGKYDETTYNKSKLFFIDDEKEYNVINVGDPSKSSPIDFTFEGFKSNILSITIGEGVKTIEKKALSGLNVNRISLPTSLVEIDNNAFEKTVLRAKNFNFIIPDKVTSIGTNAFSNFKISSGNLVINGVSNSTNMSIGSGIFDGSEFKKLSFGTKVQMIQSDAFKDNLSAASLDLGSVQTIGANAFSGWVNASGNLLISDTVTSIGAGAFTNYASKTNVSDRPDITINGISNINESAIGNGIFDGALFKSLSFGPKVKKIGGGAFKGNNSYAALDLGSVETIGKEAFYEWKNATGDLIIPDTVTFMGEDAFNSYASNITNTELYPSLTINGGSYGTNLSGVIFYNSHINNVTIGGKVETIYEDAFKNAPSAGKMPYKEFIGSLTIEDSVISIGKSAFKDCTGFNGNLNFSSGSKLTEIGEEAFSGDGMFTGELNIPDSVVNIGDSAFSNCTHFNGNLHISININNIADSTFSNCIGFTGELNIPASVENIGASAFSNCTGFTGNLNIPDGVENIGNSAFSNCTGFTGNLTIPESVKTIGSHAFYECSGFKGSLNLNEGLKEIGNNAFDGCINFTGGLTIPSGITGTEDDGHTIGTYAFRNFASSVSDSSIGELKIYSGTLSNGKLLDGKVFSGAKFKGVTIGGIVETIDQYAFYGNQTLENALADFSGFSGDLVFENSVTTIKNSAFKNVENMNSVFIPVSVTKIEDSAFENYGTGAGSLEIYGCSRTEETEDGTKKRILGTGNKDNFIFKKAKFTNVTIGGNVDAIDDYFMYTDSDDRDNNYHQKITGILKIEPLVKEIGEMAFYGNRNFDSLIIPDTVVSMKKSAFDQFGSGVGSLTIHGCSDVVDGTHILGNGTDTLFNHANFRNVTIGGNVEVIGDRFMINMEQYNYSGMIGTLTIESPVKTIGIKAFYGDSGFDSIFIPDTVISIGESAFDYSGSGKGKLEILGCRTIQDNVHLLGYTDHNNDKTLFNHANFTDVTIGGNIEMIGYRCMKTDPDKKLDNGELKYDYTGLKGNLTIGRNVKIIDEEAFNGAGFDGTLTFEEGSQLTTIEHSAFENLFYVKDGLTIPESVTFIGTQAFERFSQNSDKPGPLTIYGYSSKINELNTIQNNIFKYAKFTNVTIGGNVQSIGEGFMDNTIEDTINGVKSVRFNGISGNLVIEGSVHKIGDKAFYGCKYLNGVLTLNDSVESIGKYAFANTNFFENVDEQDRHLTIPASVKFMDECAFENFCKDIEGLAPSLTIYGYSSDNDQRLVASGIFDSSRFNNVTIGGNVYCISGIAFNDPGKYQNWTGTLTFEAGTVGFDGDMYQSNAMSYGNGWGAFHGCNFENVIIPTELHHALDSVEHDFDMNAAIFGNSNVILN